MTFASLVKGIMAIEAWKFRWKVWAPEYIEKYLWNECLGRKYILQILFCTRRQAGRECTSSLLKGSLKARESVIVILWVKEKKYGKGDKEKWKKGKIFCTIFDIAGKGWGS